MPDAKLSTQFVVENKEIINLFALSRFTSYCSMLCSLSLSCPGIVSLFLSANQRSTNPYALCEGAVPLS